MQDKKRVLFIVKDRGQYRDGKYGLWNSASLIVNSLYVRHDYNAKLVSVVDGNGIDKVVTDFKPAMVFIEALWVTPDKMRELARLHPTIKWVIRIHSKATFLAQEGMAFTWILGYQNIPNVKMSANNLEFNDDLEKLGIGSDYLPNIYTPDYRGISRASHKGSRFLHVGCFGALRTMKNHIAQAIAAIQFAESIGKDLVFHINENSDGGVDNVLKNLRALFKDSGHYLKEHSWLSHEDFCRLVVTMDIGMQVSLSESFNIVAADFVSNNVPLVACREIKFVSSWFTADNNTKSMLKALWYAYYGDSVNLQYLSKVLLDQHNEDAISVWRAYLEG